MGNVLPEVAKAQEDYAARKWCCFVAGRLFSTGQRFVTFAGMVDYLRDMRANEVARHGTAMDFQFECAGPGGPFPEVARLVH